MASSILKIQKAYSDQLCETGKKPISVYQFCKELEITEPKFYKAFASFEALEKSILSTFFVNTLDLLSKDEAYEASKTQNKLLAFYYTFFEVLLTNRTLVMLLLPHDKKQLFNAGNLKGLKQQMKDYLDSLGIEIAGLENTPLSSYQDKSIREIGWIQFLLTLQFWLKDESAGFEKTDVYIEKSLRASFDLIEKNPFGSLLDFGKFVYHETMKK
jgi:hypothetical protein